MAAANVVLGRPIVLDHILITTEPEFDPSCDIAPYTGQVPDIICQPDGVMDIPDAILFIQLWIYHHQ